MQRIMELSGRTYLSPTAICEAFSINKYTYYNWVQRGLLPTPIKIGNRKYYDREEVERRLSRGE